MDKDGKISTMTSTCSPAFPMEEISSLIPSSTITCNLPNYWCSALCYFICKQAPTLKQLISLKEAFPLCRGNFNSCRQTQNSIYYFDAYHFSVLCIELLMFKEVKSQQLKQNIFAIYITGHLSLSVSWEILNWEKQTLLSVLSWNQHWYFPLELQDIRQNLKIREAKYSPYPLFTFVKSKATCL